MSVIFNQINNHQLIYNQLELHDYIINHHKDKIITARLTLINDH